MSADPAPRHLKPVEEKPPIILVNTATGEQVGTLAQVEAAHEAEYNALQAKYRSALAEITGLKRDKEQDARQHRFWHEAVTLHDWYAIATGHPGRKFGAEEFYQALPRIKAVGPIEFLHAIAGVAFDPKKSSRPQRNGRFTIYDSWEHLTRNAANLQSYIDLAPGDPDGHEWKRWLIDHIQAQLKG